MLTALEEGVKGGKWFSLIDKVVRAADAVAAAFAKVKANDGAAGVDHQTIEMFEQQTWKQNLSNCREQLQEGSYQPQASTAGMDTPSQEAGRSDRWVYRRCATEWCKTALRPRHRTDLRTGLRRTQLWVPTRTRLQRCAATSGSTAQGRIHVDRRRRPEKLLRHDSARAVADAASEEKVADGRVLELDQQVSSNRESWSELAKSWKPEAGTPQGAVISPLLSNIYLDPLDQLMASRPDSRWCAMPMTS